MRILYVITDLEIGGVPLHLYWLARHMSDEGFEVHVTCLSPPGPVTRMLAEAGIPTSACHAGGAWDWRAIDRLNRITADLAPDIVHSFLFHANIACRFVALLGALATDRLICELQTVEVERSWHLTMERLTHRWCRYVVANSPSVVDHLAQRARIASDRLVLVQGGIDPTPIRESAPAKRSSLGVNESDPVLLWTGRLDPVKRLDDLISAATVVNRSIPIQVLLAGEGPDRPRLERRVGQSGIADRVHLLGQRTDVPRLLKTADLFVFPSLTEGMPNALLEAMAAALPIVATDAPGNRDLITHNENGLLVPIGDCEKLAGAIANLLRDRTLRQRLGACAARAIDRQFHIARTYGRYRSLYARLAPLR
ncbi:MAG: glycosyltransferase [Phycisphaerales bacterium]|nr:MAG: glycosyltransferase [Phycisphaerales bacterium]